MSLTKKISEVQVELYEALSDKQRKALPDTDFAIQDRRAWPIQSAKQAMIAIAFMKQGKGEEADYKTVKAAIQKRYKKNEKVMKALQSI